MRWKRLFYYLLLNILVSAGTILAVLYAWERYRPQPEGGVVEIVALPTAANQPAGSPAAATTGPGQADSAAPDFVYYTVQQGDTLSTIAEEFGVTVEDILAANDLENPDALSVGDVLGIPLTPGAVPPVPTDALLPTDTPVPQPTLDPSVPTPQDFGEPELDIALVIGAGDLAEERIQIQQTGDAQVSLLGWQVQSPDGQVYTFPQLMLFKDGAVTLYTKAGANNVTELYWGLDQPVWESGAVVTLLDPAGNIVAAYQIP